ncbi:MAG: hypothetical protein AAGD07_25600, partial [Planctomycetota bacterium]
MHEKSQAEAKEGWLEHGISSKTPIRSLILMRSPCLRQQAENRTMTFKLNTPRTVACILDLMPPGGEDWTVITQRDGDASVCYYRDDCEIAAIEFKNVAMLYCATVPGIDCTGFSDCRVQNVGDLIEFGSCGASRAWHAQFPRSNTPLKHFQLFL